MDTLRYCSMSTNEETEIELGKLFNNKMKPLETSENDINAENGKINLSEELEENVQHNILSFQNVSFSKMFENDIEDVEGPSKPSNEASISKIVETKEWNEPVENLSSSTVIHDTIAKLNCSWTNKNNRNSNLQPYQSNEGNILGISSTLRPASMSCLANAKQHNNSFSYSKNVLDFESSGASEEHHFDYSKANTFRVSSQYCLPFYNLGNSFIDSYQKLSDFMKLENSRNIVQDLLSSQISVCTSPESNIGVGDPIELLLKRHINLDSRVKCTLTTSSESELSNTNKVVFYPEKSIEIKEKQKNLINQINNASFQLFEECNKHIIIENGFSKNTEFLKTRQGAISNNWNSKTNLSLVGTRCSMNLSNQLGETQAYEQHAENAQAFLKHKLLSSDTMTTKRTARKKKSLNSLRDITVNETIIFAPQNEINKPLVHSDNTQLQGSEVTINISKIYKTSIGNNNNQTFNIKPSAEWKSLSHTLSKLKANISPKKVSSDSFIADISSDCTVKSCNLSLKNIILVLPLPGIMENGMQAKLLSNHQDNVFPFFKGVAKRCHSSLVQSEVNEKVLCNPSKGKNSIYINERLASYTFKQLEEQKQLHDEKSRSLYLSSLEVFNKPLLNTMEFMQGISNINDLSRKEGALVLLNDKKSDVFDHVEVSETIKCNNLLSQTELFSISSSSDDLINNTTASNEITLDKTIQLDGDTLCSAYCDNDIDKAIDESMKKYAIFTCDTGVLATPDTSDKSCQTDKTLTERQLSCKRCLNFDEDYGPSQSKRTKTYYGSSKTSKFSCFEQVGTSSLTELMNGSNNCIDDLTRSKNSSLTINQDVKDNVNMYTLYGESSNLNDEFSLYDEEMDVGDELNWSKDSKEIHESNCDLSDHRVPTVEEVSRTELVKSPMPFPNTPKKPTLKVGLSRSARLKPLHQK